MHRTYGRFNIESRMRTWFAILLFLSCSAASAQWAPSGSVEARNNANIAMRAGFLNWDDTMYASCTNNRADVVVSWATIPEVPTYWTSARITGIVLKLNGTTVQTWSPGQVAPPSVEIGVMYDSTHFESESSVTWRLEASIYLSNNQTSTTETFVREVEVPVRNWARLFGRYDLEVDYLNKVDGNWVIGEEGAQGLPAAEDALSTMDYDVTEVATAIGWDMDDLADAMYENCVFYVHTHGNQSFFWSDSKDYWYEYLFPPGGTPECIYGSGGSGANYIDLIDYREDANGTGLPPYNSTGSPPINVAFLDCCSAGTTNAFSTILYPYGNWFAGAPSSYPENQSLVGYNLAKQSDQTTAVGEAFWGTLAEGYTVDEARTEAFNAYEGSNKPEEETDFMHVWGDFYTRLKGVYTGDQSSPSPSTWYRNL